MQSTALGRAAQPGTRWLARAVAVMIAGAEHDLSRRWRGSCPQHAVRAWFVLSSDVLEPELGLQGESCGRSLQRARLVRSSDALGPGLWFSDAVLARCNLCRQATPA